MHILATDILRGQIAVDVTSNAEGFSVEMGGDLGDLPLQQVRGSDAALTRTGSGVAVQSSDPGSFNSFWIITGT
ncbi:MAG TPA: hypothetical protein VF695_09990 [Sphingomonas sp.]|jgi:hypothetical protein